jgi:drug/metabolite transporter (DMT)-like permease
MTIAISTVVVLAIATWLLVRHAGLRLWHGLVCILLGVYLGITPVGDVARAFVNAIVHAVSTIA